VLVESPRELLVDETVDEPEPISDRALISHIVRLILEVELRRIFAPGGQNGHGIAEV
jgi:hypothetical protein